MAIERKPFSLPRRLLRNSLILIVIGIVAVRLHARSMLTIEADPRLVNQRGAERVSVTKGGSHGIHDLVAIIKASTVRIAGKGSRNKLGIVRPAIA